MKSWMKMGWMVWVAAAMVAGCETSKMEDQGTITLGELQGIPAADTTVPAEDAASDDSATTAPTTASTDSGTSTNVAGTTEIDGPITWLHTDVSSWPVTASLDAKVSGGTISMPYSKSKVWPAVDGVNANPWVIVKYQGKWYAATFEWFRFGQTSKPVGVLDGSKGDHIKVSPLNNWRPSSGERFGMMVSGLARTKTRNVKERSNIDMVTWP